MTSSYSGFNHVGKGSNKANGITDRHNIIEAQRQFQSGLNKKGYNERASQKAGLPSSMYIAALSQSWGTNTSTANINEKPLRGHDRIPVLLENSVLIYACVSALQQHLGLSKTEIRGIAEQGGLTIDFINNFAPAQIAALYDELDYHEAA